MRPEEKVPFVVMAKPVGSLCNMRCAYCYYLDTAYGEGASPARMSDETLETFIRSYIEASPGPAVSFTWHGGEPAIAGIPFYEKVLKLQEKYLPEGFSCWNSLQTNGTLLDDTWCAFLRDHHFDVGLSIDGTAAIQDRYRLFPDGRGSWEVVTEALERLKRFGIAPDLLCTVTSDTARNGHAVYKTLRSFGTGWVQFIPIVRYDAEGKLTPDSVTPEGYGTFLKDVFFEWFYHDLGRLNVQFFAEISSVLAGGKASLCWMKETCGNVLVVEYDGGIYACDHFVDEAHRIGTVGKDDFRDVLASPFQKAFGEGKRESLPGECRACPYLPFCGGGCLKDRTGRSADGEPGRYLLCPGLKDFFAYAVPRLKTAMVMSGQGFGPDAIMREAASAERARLKKIGRNDPCPCGSGRKFKQCCAGRIP